MEGDTGSETQMTRGDVRMMLARLPIFMGLDAAVIEAIAAEIEWFSLPGGALLCAAGEASDAMYFLLSGCLGAYAPAQEIRGRPLARIVAGETVGEMGLISGRPRNATVAALRDSELGRLSRAAFERVYLRSPAAMLRIAELTVDRLESAGSRSRGSGGGPRTFTLLPQSIEVDVATFASEFIEALSRLGRAELVWSVRGATHTSHWFHRLEAENDYVVYVADPTPTTWSKLCVRQADALLLLARADTTPGPWQLLASRDAAGSLLPRAELVLLHEDGLQAGRATTWLGQHGDLPHHHVAAEGDVARVARMLTGSAVGIVLSGGGARGFAHIGVVKALKAANIPIDLVGGTSMGAIMGAGVAAGWTVDEMIERYRRTFVATNPLSDYTLPVVSLVSGRKVSRLLRQEFGDVGIEDLQLPFFCVSSNLTSGRHAVHRSGALWRWLRASIAIPGVLPPVFAGGEVFVDGGAMNNLPVDVMREQARGPVIGVDVGADRAFIADMDDVDVPPLWKMMAWFRRHRRGPNIFQILWRSGMVNSASATAAHREQTDLLLQPPLELVDMLNWQAFDRAIEAGYRYTMERLESLPDAALPREGR